MEITFYQSECGDSAKISFIGSDGKPHHFFIDSGFERTFKNTIRKDVEEIIQKKEKIDLWSISHIHDDHIGGIKKYIDYINTGELKDIVSDWVYNPPRFYDSKNGVGFSVSIAKSIDQGDILYKYLKSINKNPKKDYTSDSDSIELFGMKIIFLSPSKNRLLALRKKYSVSKMQPFELLEEEAISEAVGVVEDDYHIKLEDFDLDSWNEDDSIENGSSICFITEYKGKSILWLADAHPSDVTNSLLKLGYSKTNKLKCEFVKVTHHGSKGNNSNELYDLIDSENYIISSNGENKYKLPNKESLARILRNSNRNLERKYNIYFNYDNDTVRKIFENDNEKIYDEYNFQIYHSKNSTLKFLIECF